MNDLLHYKNYFGSVHYSGDDDVFYGKVLGINDLVSFEGASVQELKTAFQEAVDDYLITCAALKKNPETTYEGTFNVQIPRELHRQAALEASVKGMSLNDFVQYALDLTLGRKFEDDPQTELRN